MIACSTKGETSCFPDSEKKKKKAAKAAEQTVFVNKTPKGEKKGNREYHINKE